VLEEIRRRQRIPPKLTGGIKVDRPSRSALGAFERIRLRLTRPGKHGAANGPRASGARIARHPSSS